jgi:hypothetical protein
MSPPTESPAKESPALMETDAPTFAALEPAATEIDPAGAEVPESPVDIATDPVDKVDEDPVASTMLPDVASACEDVSIVT